MTARHISPRSVQGWVARGYTHPFVRHVVVQIDDSSAMSALLGAVTGDDPAVPQVTSGARWKPGATPPSTLNIAFTFVGLQALGVPETSLATFPSDFRSGIKARAAKIGDFDESDPSNWTGRLGHPHVVHAIVTMHAMTADELDRVTAAVLSTGSTAMTEVSRFDGQSFPDGVVHFGYKDGIAQPRVEGLREDAHPDSQPLTPTGALVLGYPSQFENLVFTVPQPDLLGRDGTYNAFRVLKQDVVGFAEFITKSAIDTGLDPDMVTAKLLGRWPNGNPLVLSPVTAGPEMDEAHVNDYGYDADPEGLVCPIGSHMRRANPRDSKVVQRGFGHSRRIVRRGTPYGTQWDPGMPKDDVERGLLGNFMCASLSAQFEAVMYDWVNLGLQHPDITGLNDPMLGANDKSSSRFDIPTASGTHTLRGFDRFVTTRGGAYTFIPSMAALRLLAGR